MIGSNGRSASPIPAKKKPSGRVRSGLPDFSDETGLVTRRLSEIAPEEVEWLWRNRIPNRRLSVIHGDPGVGKTWVALDITAHLTTGRAFPDGSPCEVVGVLFVTAEDGLADTIRPRVDLLRGDPARVHCLDLVRVKGRETSLDLQEHIELVGAWLEKHGDVGLLILDPLAAFLGKTDAHRNNEVRALLKRVADLAEKLAVGIVGIDHLVKAQQGRALARGIGSIAFTAAPRAVWQIVADPDDPERRLFLPVKMNLAKTSGLAFRLIKGQGIVWEKGAVTLSPDDVSSDAGGTPRAEAREWLRGLLKPGPCPAVDIERKARQDGICLRTLAYAKKELGVESKRWKGSWSWLWPQECKPLTPRILHPLPSYILKGSKTVKK